MQDRLFTLLTKKTVKGVARHKPAADLTVYPNGNGDGIIDPQELLASFRKLEAQTPSDVRILRRRVKKRSPL